MEPTVFEELVVTNIISKEANTVDRPLKYKFWQKLGSTNLSSFVLIITDPQDPSFLLDLVLSSNDFLRLKSEEAICVEFPQFATIFKDHLSWVNNKDEYQAQIDFHNYDPPKFLLQQKLTYRTVPIMSFGLVPANEKRLNEYLAGEVNLYKRKFLETQAELSSLQKTFELNSQEFSDNMDKNKANQLEFQRKVEQRIFEIEKTDKEKLESIVLQYENEKRSSENRYREEIKRLKEDYEEKLKESQRQNSKLTNEKNDLETKGHLQGNSIENLKTNLNTLQKQFESSENESIQKSKKIEALKNQIHELETLHTSAKEKCLVYEDTMKQTKNLAMTNGAATEGLREQLKKKDQEIEEYKKTIANLSSKAQERDWIANKSKEVIEKEKKRVEEMKKHHEAKKVEYQHVKEEKERIEQLSFRLKKEVKSLKEEISKHGNEKLTYENKIEELRTQIQNLEETISSDRDMIDLLEKQLNSSKLRGGFLGTLEEDDPLQSFDDFGSTDKPPFGNTATQRFDLPPLDIGENSAFQTPEFW